MAGLPTTDLRTLNTMISATLDTYSGDPVNFVNEAGEKVMKKMAAAGRIFAVNDAERVEHPVMHGTDGEAWSRYAGDDYAGTAATLGVAQNEIITKALFTIKDATKNLNIPQNLIGRPSTLAQTEIQYLVKRAMMEIYQEEEMWFLLGVGTSGGTQTVQDPFSADANYSASAGSMSALGLLTTGQITAGDKFANIDADPTGDGDAAWAPQVFQASSATAASLDGFIGDIQNTVIQLSKYGGLERPTHGLSTIDWYNKFVEALRAKTVINDTVIRNLGVESEIPFAGMMFDYSAHLVKDALWNTDGSNTNVAEIPCMFLNLNSLRLNLVYGGSMDEGGGFVKKKSSLAPHPQKTTFFTRLHYRYCWSVDNGRRSMGQLEGWTFGS